MAKPLIFGESRKPEDRFDPDLVESLDPSYIPGYSEIVRANDLAKADDLLFREIHRTAKRPDGGHGMTKEDFYKQIGAAPQPLPVEFKALRTMAPNGSASASATWGLAQEEMKGFRPATKEDFEAHGFGLPPGYSQGADGLFHRADTTLYIRSGEVARKWERHEAAKAASADKSPLAPALVDGSYHAPTFREEQRETKNIATKD